MNKKSKISLIMICLLAIISFGLSSCAKRAEASPQTYTGIVTDVHCYLKKPEITLDTKKCLQMPACAATGYGIVIVKEDKTTEFYFLDGDFAPNATGAQLTVAKLIDASAKTDHFYFTIKGSLSGETKKIAYEKNYKVLNVTDIVESNGN